MGNITIQGDLTGDVPGGEVGGASNLTTVGAIPYVSAAGILNQDPTALFWDAANDRLGIRISTPAVAVQSNGTVAVTSGTVNGHIASVGGIFFNFASNIGYIESVASGVSGRQLNIGGFPLVFTSSHTTAEIARFTTSSNFLIGTTTDSNFKLDVAASGSAGTARFYGGAGVSNSTKVVVQAGGGQSGNLQEWQNAAGSVLGLIGPTGSVEFPVGATYFRLMSSGTAFVNAADTSSGLQLHSGWGLKWGSSSATSSPDTAVARNAAGVVEVNNGTAGTYRDLILRRSQHNGVTVAALPAAAAGNAGSIQYVTDANATTIGSTVAGGGANKVMVWSDGAAWKIFAS